jgi:hypothetical protein
MIQCLIQCRAASLESQNSAQHADLLPLSICVSCGNHSLFIQYQRDDIVYVDFMN